MLRWWAPIEVEVDDAIRAEQKALYQDVMRLKAELAKRKWPPRAVWTGVGNAPQKNIAPRASTQAAA